MSVFNRDDADDLRRGDRAIIVAPEFASGRTSNLRDREGRLAEAAGLALAIGIDVVGTTVAPLRRLNAGTLFGSGKVAEIAAMVEDASAGLVIVDGSLSAIQQRNLETAWSAKVIDRTALILEIFGERAATAEGRLQVELAHLDYQAGRLVRSWTHLERQRGGFGFLGGPGETQIEADRRMIRDRMARLRRQLADVQRTRGLHRSRRQRAPWPVVALVGYTNAGKSTLFNYLTKSDVMAADMLFATLDPTMREIRIAGLGKTILSDTVGFVSDLPTQLVAAFRATLEEVRDADLLLHVRDISHPETEAQRADVLAVLADIGIGAGQGDGSDGEGGIEPDASPRIVEVFNKIDLLEADERTAVLHRAASEGAIAVSATTGAGTEQLLDDLASILGGRAVQRQLLVPIGDGARQAWLHRHAKIHAMAEEAAVIRFDVSMTAADNARYDKLERYRDGGDAEP